MQSAAQVEVSKESSPSPRLWLAKLSVADGIYLAIVVAAAVMRLFELGKIPLSPEEAKAAWSVWRVFQPGHELLAISSPAYFSLTLVVTQILGYSDTVARLFPAAAGLGTVALPWLMRERLGNKGAIALAGLFTLSPLHSIASRTAGGDSIAVFALMLMLTGWLRYQDSGEKRWRNMLILAFGLGLTSSPLFYGAVATLLLAAAAQSAFSPPARKIRLRFSFEAEYRQSIILGAAVFLAASTILLLYPGGLGASSRLPVEWIAKFTLRGGLSQLVNPFMALGRYEVLLFIPGAAAIVWALRARGRLPLFCVFWLASAVVLAVFQQGYMQNALLALVPGYLLVALFIDDSLSKRFNGISWITAVVVLLSASLILANVARYSRAVIYDPQDIATLWMAVMVAAVALAAVYFVGSWNATAAMQGVLVGWLLVSAFYLWGTAWWLGHEGANDPRERWVESGTDDDIRIMVDVINRISQQATGSNTMLDIFSTVDSYVLRWYLRDVRLSIGSTLPADSSATVIISPSEASLMPDGDYLGADFGLFQIGMEQPAEGSRSPFLDVLRWWMLHESSSAIKREQVVLWWRSSLIQEN